VKKKEIERTAIKKVNSIKVNISGVVCVQKKDIPSLGSEKNQSAPQEGGKRDRTERIIGKGWFFAGRGCRKISFVGLKAGTGSKCPKYRGERSVISTDIKKWKLGAEAETARPEISKKGSVRIARRIPGKKPARGRSKDFGRARPWALR